MTYIVALSGGIASGKSTVANYFAKLGVPIVDADVIARQVVQKGTPALQAIIQYFGADITLLNGELDRTKLRQIVFNDESKRLWLNQLLHPIIQAETEKQIHNSNAPYVLWVVPLLIENKLYKLANHVLIIDTPPEIQLARLTARDNITEALAQQMINAQISNQQRLIYADDIIDNTASAETLALQVKLLHNRYLQLAKSNEKELKRYEQ